MTWISDRVAKNVAIIILIRGNDRCCCGIAVEQVLRFGRAIGVRNRDGVTRLLIAVVSRFVVTHRNRITNRHGAKRRIITWIVWRTVIQVEDIRLLVVTQFRLRCFWYIESTDRFVSLTVVTDHEELVASDFASIWVR